MQRRTFVLAMALSALAANAAAQCPEGGEPPCRIRPDPSLDANRWIVVPFTNTTRDSELAWLSDASVGLISTDLSWWKGIRVVSSDLVMDMVRDFLETGRSMVGLQPFLDMARRAGAGRLVIGDYLRTGPRTTINARVVDVRTGERIRSVSEVAVTDSVANVYQRLAPRLLNLAIPAGTTLGGIGTQSVDALRSYMLGLQARERWREDSALFYFRRAMQADSMFALAEVQIAGRGELAIRHASLLPERERLVVALRAGTLPRAEHCRVADQLIARDSSDAEAWYARGVCRTTHLRFYDAFEGPDAIVHATTTPNGPATVWSLEEARQAFARAIQLQPGLSWAPFISLMSPAHIPGCVSTRPPCPPADSYFAANVFAADTIAIRYERIRSSYDGPARTREAGVGRRARLIWARDFAARMTALRPQSFDAHYAYGLFALRLGDIGVAQRQLSNAAIVPGSRAPSNANVTFAYRAEAEWKAGRPDKAAALIDTMGTNGGASFNNRYEAAFGWSSRQAARFPQNTRSLMDQNAIFTGAIDKDFIRPQLAVGQWRHIFHVTRRRPAADTAAVFSLDRFQARLTLGDTVRARAELATFDAWGRARADDWWDGYEMFAAESYLELGDTTTAWSRIAPFAMRFPLYDLNAAGQLIMSIGRAWLLYADLARASGHSAEAKKGYQMVVGMWARADDHLQPFVTRARKALADLGGP